MANIDDILKKSQAKLEKHGLQKKIQRTGPKRPWQEGLIEETSIKSSVKPVAEVKSDISAIDSADSKSVQEITADVPLNATESAINVVQTTPIVDKDVFKTDHFNASEKNIQQNYNKLTSEPTTVVQQISNKPTSVTTTNIQQTYNDKVQTYNKLTSEPTTVVQQKSTTVVQRNIQQISNKHTTKLFSSGVSRLSGQGLRALNYLFEMCIGNGSRLSGPLSIEALAQAIECTSVKTAQTVIYRLEKDGFILRSEFKAGRGGWTSYEIPQEIYNQMVQFTSKPTTNLLRNLQHTYNKPTSQLTSEPTSNASSKIDSKNINNLTNYLRTDLQTLTWFKDLDFSKVHPITPMLVNTSIRSLVQQKLNPEITQDFLNRFTSWMATQNRISNPVGIFCDKLKELANEGDSPVLQCMTEEERQVEASFAAQVEKARVEMELIRKARIENAEKEADSAFEKWYNSTDESEKINLAEPTSFAPLSSEAYKRILRAVYFEKVNPKE